MRSPPQLAEIKPVAVRMNVLRDSSLIISFSSMRHVAQVSGVAHNSGMQLRLYLLITELVKCVRLARSKLMT
jgi:hypothetical protein